VLTNISAMIAIATPLQPCGSMGVAARHHDTGVGDFIAWRYAE
jgi:hypothetical protein